MKHPIAITGLLSAWFAFLPCFAQERTEQAIVPVPKVCETPGVEVVTNSPLPNIVTALKERKKINILVIGTTSASLRGPVSGDHYAILERFLEAKFKGLDVAIVYRGVSGELAADAAERIRTEVALNSTDLVLWQLGTADALAQVPLSEFHDTVTRTVEWLKAHKVDVILVGLRYTRSMSRDKNYQATRQIVKEIAKEQNVLRFGLYEAQETLEQIRQGQGVALSEIEATESDYACMGEYLARAIATGLFIRDAPHSPSDDKKLP